MAHRPERAGASICGGADPAGNPGIDAPAPRIPGREASVVPGNASRPSCRANPAGGRRASPSACTRRQAS